ncbi:helix-turn-helix protein [Salegentibacter sp. 24]|jgi:DNA-binding XRE family transcriptional regulator|uniref:helix-turn-helix domain-containing protein n=1 Tax=Salegentibacter sp. 24 TaxID=2183986 RepID=UPI0010605E9B|nr:helix-turn-helix transcriptional regulator [Salegentibacter sp. 24]TDN90508.1 helix-turn-helix protein [Salegentibacter sp. 24]
MLELVTIKQTKEELGKWCKLQRGRFELSQQELADHLGLSRYTIQKFESGKNSTIDTVLKIAHHFDDLEKFYSGVKAYNDQNTNHSLY